MNFPWDEDEPPTPTGPRRTMNFSGIDQFREKLSGE